MKRSTACLFFALLPLSAMAQLEADLSQMEDMASETKKLQNHVHTANRLVVPMLAPKAAQAYSKELLQIESMNGEQLMAKFQDQEKEINRSLSPTRKKQLDAIRERAAYRLKKIKEEHPGMTGNQLLEAEKAYWYKKRGETRSEAQEIYLKHRAEKIQASNGMDVLMKRDKQMFADAHKLLNSIKARQSDYSILWQRAFEQRNFDKAPTLPVDSMLKSNWLVRKMATQKIEDFKIERLARDTAYTGTKDQTTNMLEQLRSHGNAKGAEYGKRVPELEGPGNNTPKDFANGRYTKLIEATNKWVAELAHTSPTNNYPHTSTLQVPVPVNSDSPSVNASPAQTSPQESSTTLAPVQRPPVLPGL